MSLYEQLGEAIAHFRSLSELASATVAPGFASMSAAERENLARAWDAWRERPSWGKRGQNKWYDCPKVKAALGLAPGDKVPGFVKRLKRGDLQESALTEGGIGGRIAGARRAYSVPPPDVAGARDMTPELIKKRKRELEQRQDVRERLRVLAIESRRPLKTLDEMTATVPDVEEWWDYSPPGAIRAITKQLKLSSANRNRWNALDWERVMDYYVRIELGDRRGYTRGRNV